ncbi:unnamed protein product, partial [Soboliphyme baturini]|uniref:Anion exchange protein n=1 Tax=Soboliphyme baturini TaxID=241478 RepID=A0A183IRU1_9BILA
ILLAQLPDLKKPLSAFVTLQHPKQFANLNEVSCPTKFLFLLLAPDFHSMDELLSIGQCAGALLTDPNFRLVASYSQDVTEIVCGIDEFYRDSIMIPPGKWHCDVRLEPNEQIQEIEVEKKLPVLSSDNMIDLEGLQYTGKIFGGLMEDIKRRMPYYLSDFKDGFSGWRAFSQCMAAAFFLFFANLTNIIAFGGIMGSLLDNNMAVTECIIAAIISGCLFGFFAGQPLCIMSATGPVLMFEALFYEFCTCVLVTHMSSDLVLPVPSDFRERDWPFLPARFWLCFWAAIILLILVAADASFLVAYITRFTEETFATLIAVVFIVESFEAMAQIGQKTPFTRNYEALLADPCVCNVITNETFAVYKNFTSTECEKMNGTLSGLQCNFKPDVFSFSIVLFCGGFLFSFWLDKFKDSRFFTNRIREMISDFSLLLSIFIMTLINYLVALPIPSLTVPTEFKVSSFAFMFHTILQTFILQPTFDRSWIVNPLHIGHWSEPLIIFFPALLLVVLIVMDQHVTTVMLNRKENQLRKGFGYHLDLLVVVILTIIAGIMGIPLFLSATILSLTHMHVLRMNSKNTAPGDKPIFLGVREQRFSTVFAHILMGLCILMAPIERHIPIPVLLGIFLYMGISCLVNIEFFQRILLFFTPMKNQPNFSYLRLVPVRRIHMFTVFQIIGLAALCIVNYVDVIELFFPLMLIALVAQRKALEWCFNEQELCILDDPLPPWKMLRKSTPLDSSYATKLIRNFGLSSKESYAL